MLHARAGGGQPVDRVLLVAPPCVNDVPAVVRFRPDGVTAAALDRAAGETLMVWSSPDPYCPGSAPGAYPGVFRQALRLEGAGHINADAGYGPWPWAEEWALG
jgi:predicted alpha/beta hydrolase family esterase